MNFAAIALALIDWGIARAEAAGEEIPQDILDSRTAVRREIARQAQDEATNTD